MATRIIGGMTEDIEHLINKISQLEAQRDALKAERDETRTAYDAQEHIIVLLRAQVKNIRAELDRARERIKDAFWAGADVQSAINREGIHSEGFHEALERFMSDSPALVSPEAEKVCVWERVGHTNEDGNPEVIWRGECGEECDVKPNRTTCDKCQRPIQLAEWE